ncbi:MAG: MFS transporter small subunit [Steroidobacteraceae bacterium]
MSSKTPSGTRTIQLILAWSFVGIPLVWGVLQTLRNAVKLFH